YAYQNWGIKPGEFRKESEAAYAVEFQEASADWIRYVSAAAKEAGLGDAAQMLREKTARFVAHVINIMRRKLDPKTPIKILDVGCGNGLSAAELLKGLSDEAFPIELSLLDGASCRINVAKETIEKKLGDLKCEYKLKLTKLIPVIGVDLDITEKFGTGNFDLVMSVAGVHAHAYLDEPFRQIAASLKPGGMFITGDWHNSMWEHPKTVYDFFNSFDSAEWPEKEIFLETFCQAYPAARISAPFVSDLKDPENLDEHLLACEKITSFWKAWAKIRKDCLRAGRLNPNDELVLLEGHRPGHHYEEEMRKSGLNTDIPVLRDLFRGHNPFGAVPHSRLHMISYGRKPAFC
ncbi:MAG: class I SAM-dependent methyltransferase, partial [Bdellovibrionales bacterium]|nr:class I SAM-dependent methyltransferase [Bdellovibrionales bacterium]